jgi:hypothetical protein
MGRRQPAVDSYRRLHETFLALNEFLVELSVLIAAVSYLIINLVQNEGMWPSALLGLATGFPFLIEFVLVDQNWAAAGKTGIGILTGLVFVMVGAGLWVTELRGQTFLQLFARALNLERKESQTCSNPSPQARTTSSACSKPWRVLTGMSMRGKSR